MKKISLLTARHLPNLSPDDALLFNYLKSESDWEVDIIIWSEFNPNNFSGDALIIRSVWDYPDHIEQFQKLLHDCQQRKIKVFNPIATIQTNMNKSYLFELQKKFGIKIPQSLTLSPSNYNLEQAIKDLAEEAVLKPIISAAGKNTFRLKSQDVLPQYLQLLKSGDQRTYIVQEFIPEILDGEISVISFGANPSHAILKRPKKGEFRVQSDHGGTVHPYHIDPVLEKEVLKLKPDTQSLLYSRSDWVYSKNQYHLMELELFEPELFFRFCPDAPARMKKCLSELL